MTDKRLQLWHSVVNEKDMTLLHKILHEQVEFHSPTIWKPKLGRDITHFILTTIIDIFHDFSYHREWVDGDNMALEFSATVDDKKMGLHQIEWVKSIE
ncbi:MAG: hypothetical protein ACI909_002089 [Planctomycetota bacterium]|jgi:hypothetical protein